MKCRLRRGDLQHSKEHLALGNDLEDASVCQKSLWDHTPPWQRIRHLQERPHHNRGELQSLAAWTIQWRVNSPSCCWTAMKSKKLTCLEFCNAIRYLLSRIFWKVHTLNAWLLQACHKRLRRKTFINFPCFSQLPSVESSGCEKEESRQHGEHL